MSRAGTPTDNAAMEAINGWLKSELFTDFHVTGKESIEREIDNSVAFRPGEAVTLYGVVTPIRRCSPRSSRTTTAHIRLTTE